MAEKLKPFFPIPFPGYPAPFWFRYMRDIGGLIKKFKLEPVDKGLFPDRTAVDAELGRMMINAEVPRSFLPWHDERGGNRGPHFHFGGEVYLVKQDQWQAFTKVVIADFQEKMQAMNSVALESLIEMDNAISGM
ncbi:MAG: hypothetical protein ABIJ61_01305 [bacterium]